MTRSAARPAPLTASGNPAEPEFSLEEYPFFLLAQVDAAYSDQMAEVLGAIGMNRPQWRVLMSLHQKAPRSMSELATLATMKLSTISRVVDRMRADGLVACAPRERDGRVTEVFLEPAGEAALQEIVRVAGLQYQRAMHGLSEARINALRDTLRHINANLRRSPIG
jgi:MarR family transcriptional regulator, organic hydroperoxide resistance regulator